jgi:hypothetical protein
MWGTHAKKDNREGAGVKAYHKIVMMLYATDASSPTCKPETRTGE